MARKTTATKDKHAGRQKHENRVNPEQDHVPGHMGYTREHLEDVVATPVRSAKSGTRKNTAPQSAKSRRAGGASKTTDTTMKGRSNIGARAKKPATARRGAAASKAARAGGARSASQSTRSGANARRANAN